MSSQDISLENRMYLLIQSQLPTELKDLWVQADVAYLQDHNEEAEKLVTLIENKCKELGIEIKSISEFDDILKEIRRPLS